MQDRIKTIVQKAIKRLQGEVIGEEGDLVAGLSSTDQVDECIEAFEGLSIALQATLLQYKRRRNALTHLHRLPMELFETILRKILNGKRPKKYYKLLLPLRLVASHWERAIDGTRGFWTVVGISHTTAIPLVTMLLQKSSPLLLDLEVSANISRPKKGLMQTILQQSFRWRSIRISGSDQPTLHKLFTFPTPNLRCVSIDNGTLRQQEFEFTGVMPPVEDLYLIRTSLPSFLKGSSLVHLRQISLSYITSNFHSSQLVTLLSASPSLRSVDISQCHILMDEAESSLAVIYLPELLTLKIYDVSPTVLRNLINLLHIPAGRDIGFSVDDTQDTSLVLSVLHCAVARLPYIAPAGNMHTFAAAALGTTWSFRWGEGFRLWFRYDKGRMGEGVELCRRISSHLDPQSVRTTINVTSDFDGDTSSALMGASHCLPNVVRLKVWPSLSDELDSDGSALANVLGRPQETGDELKWLFSKVSTLEAREASEDAGHDMLELVRARWGPSAEQNIGVEAPAPLQAIRVPPGFPQSILASMAELVPGAHIESGVDTSVR